MKPFYNRTKPSEFLKAMVDGLREAYANDGQRVDMSTYGTSFHGICYGCAATWTLQRLEGRRLYTDEVRQIGNFVWGDSRVKYFEYAMDDVRRGDLSRLEHFCDLQPNTLSRWAKRWYLGTKTWQKAIRQVDKAIAEMEEVGL